MPDENEEASRAQAALKARLGRKRVKTGCLTCRKRRIKCDESRPVCRNCIKSRRACEGYQPRVLFRPQNIDTVHLPQHDNFSPLQPRMTTDRPFLQPFVVQPPDPDGMTFTFQTPTTTFAYYDTTIDATPHHNSHFSDSSWSSQTYTSPHATPRAVPHILPFTTLTTSQPLNKGTPSSAEPKSAGSSVLDDFHQFAHLPTAQLLSDAAVEVQDDDYYDVSDTASEDIALITHEMQSRFQLISAVGSYGVLDTYRVERAASPLRNPATARVFMHFLASTGPSISPFERSASLMSQSWAVPLSQRGLWTYTLPQIALQNHGLLHAMLAMSSLQISRLQGSSATPSMQHYAWSLKKIHRAVMDRRKRLDVATIAASLLLGFWEIISADHSKWNTHLAGARQLFLEIDFDGMVGRFRQLKAERQSRPSMPASQEDLALDDLVDVDEGLISKLYGREVRYGQSEPSLKLDLSRFETLKDLYWWSCKQDAYQSIVSGNPLLVDYHEWASCPPRAPMNMPDRMYGTFDHLTLLLGRVAAFSARDKARKLSEIRRHGRWIPHPASRMAQGRASNMPAPDFYGMSPTPSSTAMPASYRSCNGTQTSATEEGWTIEEALAEYKRIREALELFKVSLGPAFQPIGEGELTPFGNALIYSTYDLGCLWSVYNATCIVAIRSHPFHHPAAHVAAAMAASETVQFANEIGRISAGISPGPPNMPLDPSFSAALAESCMPAFFAAIQYTAVEQRHATVSRIFSIARKTGWGTADLIANGCETAWVRAAEAGRGPPYERLLRAGALASADARLNGSYESLDPIHQLDEDTDRRNVRVKATARLHWAIGLLGMESDV